MALTLLALGAGLVAGALRPTRHRHLAFPRVRAWSLLALGLGTQVLGAAVNLFVLVVVSYAALLWFAYRNAHLVGMPVVALGLALNAVVIAINGGMPVRGDALVTAGLAERDELARVDVGTGRHLEDDGDRLTGLGDTIPVSALGQVASFGDLILLVGTANVVADLMARRRRPTAGTRVASGPPEPPRRVFDLAGRPFGMDISPARAEIPTESAPWQVSSAPMANTMSSELVTLSTRTGSDGD